MAVTCRGGGGGRCSGAFSRCSLQTATPDFVACHHAGMPTAPPAHQTTSKPPAAWPTHPVPADAFIQAQAGGEDERLAHGGAGGVDVLQARREGRVGGWVAGRLFSGRPCLSMTG